MATAWWGVAATVSLALLGGCVELDEPEGPSPPRVSQTVNGPYVVTFRNGCTVYYNRRGRVQSRGNVCDNDQMARARTALNAYRAEQSADYSGV